MRQCVALVLVVAAITLASCGGDDASEDERDRAIDAASEAYEQTDLSAAELEVGPCIAESLPGLDNWVADVAHDPREDVDDDPANQCQRYRDGEAEHFVELTPEGELIRAE